MNANFKTKLQNFGAATALIAVSYVILYSYFDELNPVDIYQRNFNKEEWREKKAFRQAKSEESSAQFKVFTGRMDSLNKQRCEIMLKAHEEVAPIDVQFDILLGIDEKMAQELSSKSLGIDKDLCRKHGISWDGKPSLNYTN